MSKYKNLCNQLKRPNFLPRLLLNLTIYLTPQINLAIKLNFLLRRGTIFGKARIKHRYLYHFVALCIKVRKLIKFIGEIYIFYIFYTLNFLLDFYFLFQAKSELVGLGSYTVIFFIY